jgi:hypothetical protein
MLVFRCAPDRQRAEVIQRIADRHRRQLFGMITWRAVAAGGVAGMLAGVGSSAVMTASGQL